MSTSLRAGAHGSVPRVCATVAVATIYGTPNHRQRMGRSGPLNEAPPVGLCSGWPHQAGRCQEGGDPLDRADIPSATSETEGTIRQLLPKGSPC